MAAAMEREILATHTPVVHADDVADFAMGRVSVEADGQATPTLQRRYDGARLAEQSDPSQTTRYRYDSAGQLGATDIELKDDQGAIVYRTTLASTTDPATGQALSHTLADGQVMRIERDGSGAARRIGVQSRFWSRVRKHLPAFMQDWLPQRTVVHDLSLHPFSGVSSYTHGNGMRTARGFDIAGRLTTLSTGQITQQRLSYGVGPRIQEIVDEAAKINARYAYDGFGALRQDDLKVVRTSATPDNVEQDHLGRVISDGTHRYAYTPDGQLEIVKDASGRTVARYRYNAASQRVSKTVYNHADAAQTTYFLWQGQRLVAEIDGSGKHAGRVSAQYLYLTEGTKAMPIAKLESVHARGNTSQEERILHVTRRPPRPAARPVR